MCCLTTPKLTYRSFSCNCFGVASKYQLELVLGICGSYSTCWTNTSVLFNCHCSHAGTVLCMEVAMPTVPAKERLLKPSTRKRTLCLFVQCRIVWRPLQLSYLTVAYACPNTGIGCNACGSSSPYLVQPSTHEAVC